MEIEQDQDSSPPTTSVPINLPSESTEEQQFARLHEIQQKLGFLSDQPGKEDQKEITKVLEEFFHLVTGISHERLTNKFTDKICEVMDDICKYQPLLEALFFSESLMMFILKDLTFGPYLPIFLRFMDNVYMEMVSHSESGKAHARILFSKAKKFFELLYQSREGDKIDRKGSYSGPPLEVHKYQDIFLLLCHTIIKLINLDEQKKVSDDYRVISEIYTGKKWDFSQILTEDKSQFYKSHFVTSGLYEEIFNCLEIKEFQTKESALCLVLLTYCIFQGNNEVLKFSEGLNYHLRFYKILSTLEQKNPFEEREVLLTLNFLFNLASDNDFYHLFQKGIEQQDIFSPAKMLENLESNAKSKYLNYISLMSEDFFYVAVKIIFEWANISEELKLCYLKITHKMLKYSCYNTLSCAQGVIENYLLVCLRKEQSDTIKKALASILGHIFFRNTGITQFKSIARSMQYKFHQLYPKSFQELVSEPVQQNFIKAILDKRSYHMSLKFIFQKIISKLLSQNDNPENFIHFSGQKSHIIVKNLSLKSLLKKPNFLSTKKEFSIFIEFRSENLKSVDKKNILYMDQQAPRQRAANQDHDCAVLSDYKITQNYFGYQESPTRTNSKRPSVSDQGSSVLDNGIENYYPRLFSISSPQMAMTFDLYISHYKDKRTIALEGKNAKKGIILREDFETNVMENQWYSLALTYSTKTNVNLYLNGQPLQKIDKVDFAPILESIDTFQTLVIGSSLIPHAHVESFNPKTSFQGQIRNFLLLPFEIQAGDASLALYPNQLSFRRISAMGGPTESISKKKGVKLDPEGLFESSLLNLNVFIRLAKLSVREEVLWISNSNPAVVSQAPRKSTTVKKKESEAPSDVQKIQIDSKGVYYIETFKFEDTLFSIGGLEAFLYTLDLLTNFDGFENAEQASEIMCEIFKVISTLAQKAYKEDVLAFFMDNGMYELAHLIQQFVAKHNATLQLADYIIEFLDTLHDNLLKYKGAHAFFWKFVVWESCSYDLQTQIFVKSLNLLNNDLKKNYFKQNSDTIGMLFYLRKKLRFSLDTAASLASSRNELENEPQKTEKQGLEFRRMLIKEIITHIFYHVSDEIAKTEFLFFNKYLAACPLDINLYEALVALISLLKLCASDTSSRHISLQTLLSTLYEVRFPSFLISTVLTCFPLPSKQDDLIENPTDELINPKPVSPIIQDKIIAVTIELIDYIILRPIVFKQGENYSENMMSTSFMSSKILKQSTLNPALSQSQQLSKSKSFAPESFGQGLIKLSVVKEKSYFKDALIQKDLFIKLLGKCTGDGVGTETLQSFMNLVKTRDEVDNILSQDRQVLNLLLNIVPTWKPEIQILFLQEIMLLIKTLKNMKIFFETPNFQDFIHGLIINDNIPLDASSSENKNLLALKADLVRTCIGELFKMPDGFSKIIALSHIRTSDCFAKIIRLHFIDIFRKVKEILNRCDYEDQCFTNLDVNSREFAANLIQLISYLAAWVTERETLESEPNLLTYEDDVFALLELLFSVASKLHLSYTTLPDFRLNVNGVKSAQVAQRINESPLYKNGGVFFTLFNLLIEVFVCAKSETRKNQAIKMLVSLLSKKSRHKKTSLKNIKNYTNPDFNSEGTLLQKIEQSNETLSNFLKTLNSQGYFEPTQDNKTSPNSPQETTVYGYVLHNLLKLLLQQKINNSNGGVEEKVLSENDNSFERKLDLSLDQSTTNIPRTTASLLMLIQEVVAQGKQHLEKLMGDFVPQIEEEKSERGLSEPRIPENLATLSIAESESQRKADVHMIRTKLPVFLEKSWERIKMCETQRKIVNSKSQKSAQTAKQSKHREFFANFLELCNTESRSAKDLSSFIQGKSRSNNDIDEASFEVDENIAQLFDLLLNKNVEYVKQWLLPNLEESCTLVLDMVHNLSKSYYQLQKVRALDYEIYLPEDKENPGDLDKFNTAIQDTLQLKELFETEFNDWEEREKRNLARIMKKWNFQKTNLTQDRGVWQTEQTSDQLIRYKIDKAEDALRRRVRLKKDRHAANKEYLSVAAYQEREREKLKALQIQAETPQLNAIRKPSEPASAYSELENSDVFNLDNDMPPDNQASVIEEASPLQPEQPELNMIEFHQIPKEEVLTDIKERAIEPTRNLKKLVEKWSKPCEKIALKGAVYGLLEIRDSKYISFSPSEEERSEDEPYCFGALKNAFLKDYKKRKQWKISSISEIHARNYNLRSTGVEIFIKEDAKTYFFNLYTKEAQQDFIECVAGLGQAVVVADRIKEFNRKNFQKKWLEGQLSNFEYLMILNTYASRSFNDINQYPVFPWIVKDFSSEFLDINNPDPEVRKRVFRDLSIPIGALNPKKKADAQEKFNNWIDDSEPAFHYGSHYSNAGSIINYLIRLEPFTSLNIELQSGKFDQADRLFSSVKNAWHSCYNNRGDFRELPPEFFYFPEFLKDCNKYDFGRTQTNRDISSVELPPWAKTAEEFIIRHREALECDYVSSHLHLWIDLIFGYKQRGEDAVRAVNVFRNIAYEGGVDLSKIEDKVHQSILLQQIFHLGQTPTQLFTTKHPQKTSLSPAKLSNFIFSREDPNKNPRKLTINLLLKDINPQTILYLSKEKDRIHIVFKNLELYSVPFQLKSILYDSLKWNEVKSKCNIIQLGRIAFNDFSPGNQFSILAQSQKPTYIVVGGYLDNSFKILREEANIEVSETIQFHKKVVTAVDTAYIPRLKQSLIAIGSKDCRISLWDLESQSVRGPRETKRNPSHILYGHHNEITALFIQKTLGLLVSCDKDQVILVFCISSGKLLKSMYLSQHLPADDIIKTVKVDENGFIVLITIKSYIMVYTINGQLIRTVHRYSSQAKEITNVSFIDKLKPYIVIATKGSNDVNDLIILDFLSGKELMHPNMNSQWNDRSCSGLSDQKVESLLKSSAPVTMVIGESGKHIYIGYENGCVGIMGKHYHKNLEDNKSYLTQFGFDLGV